MTYRVAMLVDNPRREVTNNFAGCIDQEDARRKAASIFLVIAFLSVESVDGPKGKKTRRKPIDGGQDAVVTWAGQPPSF